MRPELFLESGEIGLFDGGLLEAEKDFLVPLQLVALVPWQICVSAAAALVLFDRHSTNKEKEKEMNEKDWVFRDHKERRRRRDLTVLRERERYGREGKESSLCFHALGWQKHRLLIIYRCQNQLNICDMALSHEKGIKGSYFIIPTKLK